MLLRKWLGDKFRHQLVDELVALKKTRYAEEVATARAAILEKLRAEPLGLHPVRHTENKKILASMGFKIHSGDYGDYVGVPDK